MSEHVHAHVAKWKKDELAEIVKLLKDSTVIGLANVDAIPSAQMHAMRKALRDDATIKISKNTLLSLALKEDSGGKKGLEGPTANIGGSTAIIATEMNPHRLYTPAQIVGQAWADPTLFPEVVRNSVVRLRKILARLEIPCALVNHPRRGYSLQFLL